MNRYQFRYRAIAYLRIAVKGAALIAVAIYTPTAWLDALPFMNAEFVGQLRVMAALFGALMVGIDPLFWIGEPLWNRYGRPAWDRVQGRMANR